MQKLILIFLILPMSLFAKNIFYLENNILDIESIHVNGEYFKVQMVLQNNYTFTVNSVEEISTTKTMDTFNPATGVLYLNDIEIDNTHYTANLLTQGDLIFRLSTIQNKTPVAEIEPDYLISQDELGSTEGEDFCIENKMRPITIYTAKRRQNILPPNVIIWANINDDPKFGFLSYLHLDTKTLATWRYGKGFHYVVCVKHNLGGGEDGNPSRFKP